MDVLPAGTITFLITDVEGYVGLLSKHPGAMPTWLARHDACVAACVSAEDGVVLKLHGGGDSVFAIFVRATDALAGACAIQRAISETADLVAAGLKVRIALHTGEPELRDGDYFGVAPSLCARVLAAAHGGQILLTQATYDLVRGCLPTGLTVRDLGSYYFKGLLAPEKVYQVVQAGLRSSFPALRATPEYRGYLPVESSRFVGRRREVAQVRAALRHVRLVTLTGPGGTGKSRLALRVAQQVRCDWRDGVWWVELTALGDPRLVARTVASALGVCNEPGCDADEEIFTFLADKEMLLVLDGCEHLVEACAAFVHRILGGCQGVKVLATSRESLRVYGEQQWPVPPLSLPEPGVSATRDIARSDAVALFVGRGRLRQPSFTLTDGRDADGDVHAAADGDAGSDRDADAGTDGDGDAHAAVDRDGDRDAGSPPARGLSPVGGQAVGGRAAIAVVRAVALEVGREVEHGAGGQLSQRSGR